MGDMPVDPELVPSQVSFPTSSTTASQPYTTALFNMALGGPQPTASSLTPDQLKIVRIIALVSSSITLVASAIVLHWFVRMRRNFRRQLIMILILCDSWKSLWSFIFPTVALSNTGIATTSDFCQASGFFFAFGIEAADFCILFIAIHSAASIFFPRTGSLGKTGLYHYRYAVYATIFLLPMLMAALAFTNKQPAYVAQTTWCYLPVRPFWYRLALAWIPRYVIMLSITGLYLAIYIYVKVAFRAYRARFRTSEFDTDITEASQLETARRHSTGGSRRASTLSVFGATFKVPGLMKNEKLREEDPVPDPTIPRIQRPSDNDETEHSTVADRIADLEKGIIRSRDDPSRNIEAMTGQGIAEPSASTRRDTGTTDNTLHAATDATATQFSCSPNTAGDEDLRKRQLAIQRQLRFLFIYPCVYVLIWLIPLINHTLQYYERFVMRPPFPLVCISAIAIPIQGAVDCILFTLREKPWRLVRKQNKQPFFSWLLGRKWDEPSDGGAVNLEAMTDGQRQAYLRREREKEENAAAKAERVEKKKRAKMQRKNSMTWWDTFERADLSGTAVERQPSRQEGETRDTLTVPSAVAGDGKSLTRNGSFSSFSSLGRRRSRSGTDLWKGFSFADSSNRQGSTSTRKQSTPLDNIAPGSIAAIEEEGHSSAPADDNVDPHSTSATASEMTMSWRSANSTTPLVDGEAPALMMKALPVLPRK
ncbi:hypothetical protein TWF696_003032 [Orbilia brochopaga]|uniref:Uncharacterized protein n=1 Tax=Orbilia brochopaga TaxID=3140254 RepID=A0AAV9U1J1_9PEZI